MTYADKLQSLIDAVNATTTLSDDNMTDAVESLISGYGKGSGKTATVTITAPTGSTVYLTDGIETLTTEEADGVWVFHDVPYGLWQAVAEMAMIQDSKEVTVVGDVSVSFQDFNPHTVLALRGDTLEDASWYGIAINPNGATAGKTDVTKFGGGSIRVNGNRLEGYFAEPIAGDYTVEFWCYDVTRSQWSTPFSFGSRTYVHIGTSEYVLRAETPSSVQVTMAVADEPPQNVWYYYTLVRRGQNAYFYIDGSLVASMTLRGIVPETNFALSTNRGAGGSSAGVACNAYIEGLRVSDYAVYDGDFTPPDHILI